jgi:hypothetical protein
MKYSKSWELHLIVPVWWNIYYGENGAGDGENWNENVFLYKVAEMIKSR